MRVERFTIGLLGGPISNRLVDESDARAIRLSGVLRDGAAEPVPDGLIETWQANAAGRYAHPADDREELPLENGFTGLDAATADLAYAESAAAARVVVNRLGPNLSALLQSIGSADSIDSALAVFGFTTADLDTAIRARARGR